MAHYQYEGLHFELPDGLSNDEAIAKIQSHLGKKSPAIPGQEGEAERVAKLKLARKEKAAANPYGGLNDSLVGAGEAALSLGSSLFSGIQAPIAAGVKRAVGMVPDWEQETARLMQEQTYQPRTEKGQDITQGVGEFLNRYIAPMGPGNLTGLAQAKGGTPLRVPREAPVEAPVAPRPQVAPQVAPSGLAPDGLPMKVEGDLFNKRAYQQELPLASSVETIADMQRAKTNPNQLDLFGDNSGGQRMAYDAEGIKLREQAAKATEDAQAARTAQEHAAAVERYRQAQQAIEERQQALSQDVARQTALDQNAAQRARQERAPTGFSTWDANRQVTEATRSAEQLRRLNEEGQQMGIVEDFGNNDPMSRMPNMRVDENGIPIRADLSMEVQNVQNPLQRNLWGDELPVRTGDHGVPLTQALDSMPPGPARDAAISQLGGRSLNKTNRFGQQGAIDKDLLTLGIPKLMGKMFAKEKEPIATFLEKLPGLSDRADEFITRPKTSADLLEAAKAEADGPNLFTNLQSGLTMGAKKTTSTMLKNMAQWFDWSQNRANYLVREAVVPLESRLAHLRKDLTNVHAAFIDEMFNGVQYTPEQLAARGLNQKSIDAYNALRSAYDMFYNEQNRARELLGKAPITRQEAYMASVFRGDYHIPIYDKSGKLRYYIQTQSRRQAKAAINWIKEKYAAHPDVDISNLKYDQEKMFAPGRKFGAVPRDVMSSWKDIADAMGDDPLAAELKQAMEQWVTDKGEHAFRQDLHHVREKVNVRGFEGDQPWLSPDKNAHNWARAQIEYLKDAAKWAATQEAIANTKTFLTDPDILQNQPNNVSLAKAYMYNHMGLTDNLVRRLEDGIAGKLGLSKSMVSDVGAMVRTGVYFKTLVANPGYIVATPLQAIWSSIGHFDMAKQQGLVKSDKMAFVRNMFEAMADERLGTPMSKLNKEALKWAEDNGVIQNIVYEDNKSVGSHAMADASQWMLDKSIGIPDRFARRAVFIPFANAFWESGKFATKAEAFRAAGEVTDAVAVSMRPQDRPLAVQKLGQLGAMAYQFHAPIINMYNNLSTFSHHGKRTGDWMPLTKSLLAMGAVGGVFSLPLVNELEKGFQLVKEFVASSMPSKYKYIKDVDPRLALLTALPEVSAFGHTGGEWLSYGGASGMLGTDLRSRFSNEIINTEDPLGSVFPSTSVYGDMIGSAAKAAMNPNAFTGTQLLKDLAPGSLARGTLETNNDKFKAPIQPYADQGVTTFRKPSDISDPQAYVNRTEKEVDARRLGVTALSEAVRREKDATSDREARRLSVARKGVFDSMFKAIVNKTGDENTIQEAVRNYLALDGNPKDIERQLERKFADMSFTRQEQQVLKAKRYEQIMNVVRRMEMDK